MLNFFYKDNIYTIFVHIHLLVHNLLVFSPNTASYPKYKTTSLNEVYVKKMSINMNF